MTTAPKTILTVAEFCAKHGACPEGRNWALANCKDMPGAWAKAKPDWLLWIATRPGVLTDKDARLFACWCVRQVWHLLKDERSKRAVRVAERFAMGKATKEELAAAKAAAWAAASDAAWDSARAAAWAAAWAAASDAAWAAAREAAWDAARAAAWDAAWDAVWDAAGDAQATYLRKKCKPNFGDTP
jgi:hypothetical protein